MKKDRSVCPHTGNKGKRLKSKPYMYCVQDEEMLRCVAMKGPEETYYVFEVNKKKGWEFVSYTTEWMYNQLSKHADKTIRIGSTASEYTKRISKGIKED